MSRWKSLAVLIVAAAVGLVALLPSLRADERDSSLRSSPAASSTAKPSATLFERVYDRLDPRHPGRGVSDYPGNTVEDIPKSYAMVLLAELERRERGIRKDLRNLAEPAGRWLLAHADLNEAGKPGWGVPVAWDAYGDGSENPANTVYSISTGIVADALITWMESDEKAPRRAIVRVLTRSLDAFATARPTPDHLLPYSLERSDRRYDTFNSAAYLAGQMQRFAQYAPTPALARRLTHAADETVRSLIRNHRVSPSKSWYWWYSKQESRANDMPHASYIIDGLRAYRRSGGRLAERVDQRAVNSHLRDFIDGRGQPRAWPRFQREIDLPPRSYDLGMALHVSCTSPALTRFADRLQATVSNYESDVGFLKFPRGTAGQEPLVVNEYEAYLWRGLVSCKPNRKVAIPSASAVPR